MPAFNKFNQFAEDLSKGVHNLHTDTLKVYLTNNAPSAANDAVLADLAGITEEHDYVPADITNTISAADGVVSLVGVDVVWTASGGSFGPFRYVVLFNDTAATKPLIGWWDCGTAVTITTGLSFTANFGETILTLS